MDWILFSHQNDEPIDIQIKKAVEPCLILSGNLSSFDHVYIAGEGMVVVRLCNMGLATALVLLVGSYYIFNMEYPSWAKNVFLFIETMLMVNCNESKKRIAINKFLKELSSI